MPPPPGSYELPAIKRVGAFTLRDTAGRPVDTRSVMAGKIAVVSFIYTACPDRLGCPLASQTLRDLQARLRESDLARQTALVSISFDPERDHPAQLAKYAQVYDADPALWRFLTAPSGRVLDAVLESYGQDRTPERDERGRPDRAHSPRAEGLPGGPRGVHPQRLQRGLPGARAGAQRHPHAYPLPSGERAG